MDRQKSTLLIEKLARAKRGVPSMLNDIINGWFRQDGDNVSKDMGAKHSTATFHIANEPKE